MTNASTTVAMASNHLASPPSQEMVVEAIALSKSYGEVTAVKDLDFQLYKGEIFGLLGPNGAGKTTTILMMMGLTEPTTGTVKVWGLNPSREPLRVKRIVGYLPEHVAFYDDLSARENLVFTADLNSIPYKEAVGRIEHAIERVGLAGVIDKEVGKFSHGMRQRLGIADVLLKQPRLVFLDEPTLGIDPEGVNQLLDIIESMAREEQITVLLSSHQLQQVQRICHRVGIFVKGKMIAEGPIGTLADKLAGGVRTLEVQATSNGSSLPALLQSVPGVVEVNEADGMTVVRASRDVRPDVAREIVTRGWELLHLRQRDFGLEEIYLRYFREG